MTHLIYLSMAVASASIAITRSGVFKGARTFVQKRSSFLGELVNCTFCTSFWISLLIVLQCGTMPLGHHRWFNVGATTFVYMTSSNFVSALLMKLM